MRALATVAHFDEVAVHTVGHVWPSRARGLTRAVLEPKALRAFAIVGWPGHAGSAQDAHRPCERPHVARLLGLPDAIGHYPHFFFRISTSAGEANSLARGTQPGSRLLSPQLPRFVG
ncbi:MAG: hypothetical protein EBT47_04120 [Chloroflexi bacterium]|nr:hypothetical protein [Chloroflexota bacterium]